MIKTTSLELSKQLKENGFPQQTQFKYLKPTREFIDSDEDTDWKILLEKGFYKGEQYMIGSANCTRIYAAPTAEEILDELPYKIEYDGDLLIWDIVRMEAPKDYWKVSYMRNDVSQIILFVEETLVEAAGKMWLYLKQNNLLSERSKE